MKLTDGALGDYRENDVGNTHSTAILVSGENTAPSISKNKIHSTKGAQSGQGTGLRFQDASKGLLDGNKITGHLNAGVVIAVSSVHVYSS